MFCRCFLKRRAFESSKLHSDYYTLKFHLCLMFLCCRMTTIFFKLILLKLCSYYENKYRRILKVYIFNFDFAAWMIAHVWKEGNAINSHVNNYITRHRSRHCFQNQYGWVQESFFIIDQVLLQIWVSENCVYLQLARQL